MLLLCVRIENKKKGARALCKGHVARFAVQCEVDLKGLFALPLLVVDKDNHFMAAGRRRSMHLDAYSRKQAARL